MTDLAPAECEVPPDGWGPLILGASEGAPAPAAPPSAPITPGAYLRKRRTAAALGLIQAGATMATLPWSIRRPGTTERLRCINRLTAAETDRIPFSRPEAELVRNVFAFDVEIYFQLLELHFAALGARSGSEAMALRAASGLPEPQLCRACACSWHDACVTEAGPCAWTADPTLCTACQTRPAPALAGEA